MLWKIYFWLFLLINVLSIAALLTYITQPAVWSSIALSLGLLIGTFFFAYKKATKRYNLWKVVFFVNLLFVIVNVVNQFFPGFRGTFEPIDIKTQIYFIIGLLPSVPAYFAVYKLMKR